MAPDKGFDKKVTQKSNTCEPKRLGGGGGGGGGSDLPAMNSGGRTPGSRDSRRPRHPGPHVQLDGGRKMPQK